MQTLLSKALVASVTVAGLGLLAAPQANAAILEGSSISFSGELDATLPTNSAMIMTTSVDATSLSFDGTTDYIFDPLTFTFSGGPAVFTLNSFSVETVGGPNSGTIITFGPLDYFKTTAGQTTFFAPLPGTALSGTDGTIAYTGVITFNQSGVPASASYSGSFSAVPEPLTMMGASAAIAFGAAFKRRNANKG